MVITCHCATKFQWHHTHFQLFEFEFWVLVSSESLSCSFSATSLGKAQGHSQLPDDDFITDMKHPWLSASNLEKAKQCFTIATISSEKIKAAKKPIIVKNTQKSIVRAVHVFTPWAEEQNKRSDQKCPIEVLCTSDMTELCHWLCVSVKEVRRDNGQPYTRRSLMQLR